MLWVTHIHIDIIDLDLHIKVSFDLTFTFFHFLVVDTRFKIVTVHTSLSLFFVNLQDFGFRIISTLLRHMQQNPVSEYGSLWNGKKKKSPLAPSNVCIGWILAKGSYNGQPSNHWTKRKDQIWKGELSSLFEEFQNCYTVITYYHIMYSIDVPDHSNPQWIEYRKLLLACGIVCHGCRTRTLQTCHAEKREVFIGIHTAQFHLKLKPP